MSFGFLAQTMFPSTVVPNLRNNNTKFPESSSAQLASGPSMIKTSYYQAVRDAAWWEELLVDFINKN